ncbi:MAG: MoaD/ThiS family protein [Desulfobacterales bacterium]
MNVTIHLLGLFKEYIGTDTADLELPEGAVYGDLLAEIGRRFGESLPKSLWDSETLEFKPGILCVGEGRDLERKDQPLKPGESISIVVHMAGG